MSLRVFNQVVELTNVEFQLFSLLYSQPGRIFSRQYILDNIYQGYADRLATAFLPSGFGFAEDLEPFPYDPERAKELLQEAGYSTN